MSKTINEMLDGSSSLLKEFLEDTDKDISFEERVLDVDDDNDFEFIVEYLNDNGLIPEELHYEDLTVCVGVIPGVHTLSNGDPGYPDEAIEGEADWDYKYDLEGQDIVDYIESKNIENFDWNNVSGKQIIDLFGDGKDFENFLIDRYEDEAQDDAWENYDYKENYWEDYSKDDD